MNENKMEERLFQRLNEHMSDGSTATSETRILADTTMDSVKVMDFILELEDELDITIPLNRLANVETAGDLVEEIKKLQQEAK